MAGRIPESALVVPALECIYDAGGEITTTDLIGKLTKIFEPEGDDLEILEDRSDTRFSQKVRNLKSHKTLERMGLAIPIPDGFRITDRGREYVDRLHSSD